MELKELMLSFSFGLIWTKSKWLKKLPALLIFSEVAGSQYFTAAMHLGSTRKQSLCINTGVRLRTSDPPVPPWNGDYTGLLLLLFVVMDFLLNKVFKQICTK